MPVPVGAPGRARPRRRAGARGQQCRGRLVVDQAVQRAADEGVARAERVDHRGRDGLGGGDLLAVVQHRAAPAPGDQDIARAAGRCPAQQFGTLVVVQMRRRELRHVHVRQQVVGVPVVDAVAEVEGHPAAGGQFGHELLEAAAVSGVHDPRGGREGEVLAGRREQGDATVGGPELAIAVGVQHLAARGLARHHPQPADIDRLGGQRVDEQLPARVVADRADVGAAPAGPGRRDRHVDRVAAGEHLADGHVAVADVVTDGDDVHQ